MRFICRGYLPCAHSASIKMRHLLSDAPQGAFWMLSALCVCVCICVFVSATPCVCVCVWCVVSVCLCLQSFLPRSFPSAVLLLQGSPFLCSSPSSNTSEEGKETHLCQATSLRNCLSLSGISILDKLIKTCPIWLQLNMNQERAAAILGKEAAGVSPKWFHCSRPHFLPLGELVRGAVLLFMWKHKYLAIYTLCFHYLLML